ncbi:MAG: HEAT repeat domain-containing protein [Deltaproteobacteria bacterium]|nr:HEAT repeat domain-containing protein [Deltaproteobacteria bacterium]
MRRAALLCMVLAGSVTSWPSRGEAQDEWGLRRHPGKRPPSHAPGKRPGKRPAQVRPPQPGVDPGSSAQESDPRRRQLPVLAERYRRALERDPREGFALTRLLEITRELHGSIDPLIEEFRRRVESEAEPFVARMILGHLYKAAARNEEALAQYIAAAAVRPTSPVPVLAAAKLTVGSDPAEARRLYDRALGLTSGSERTEILHELVELALDRDDIDGARRNFDQIIALTPSSVFLRMEWGQLLMARRKYELAAAAFEEVVRFTRGDARASVPALRELARCQIELGRSDDAIQTLRRALVVAGQASGLRRELYEILTELYRRRDDLRGLIAELERGAAARGFEKDELLARLYDEIGDEEHAVAAYRRALAQSPRDIDTRVRLIQLLERSGRNSEVREEYHRLIAAAPTEPRFALELAEIHFREGDRARALQLLQSIGARHASDPDVHSSLAELYARWGEAERATREIEILARIDPAEPSHIVALGEEQYQAGQRDRAVETWRRLLHLGSDRARAKANLADVYGDHDMVPQAIDLYREAVAMRPQDVDLRRGLASLLERNRNLDDAATEWQRVLDLAGDDRILRREARSRIVGIWSLSRTLATRLPALERRFADASPDLEAGRFLGEAYLKLRRLADAERALRRVVSLAPGDIESFLSLERVLVQKGDLAGAVEVLKRLAELEPRRAREFYQRIASYALQIYRDDEAVEFASRAVDLNPSDAQAHARLAQLYRSRQDYEHAIASYRRAIEIDDRLFSSYFELAEIHLMRGATREADLLYRAVIRGAPDDEMVTRAARLSVQLNLSAGTLEDLEREIMPVAVAQPRRPVFRRALVDLYTRLAWPLIQRARNGGADDARQARDSLRRIGQRALKPLLEALADQDPAQRRAAVDILGYLGNPNAAPPLLATAESDDGDVDLRARALVAAVALADARLIARLEALATSTEIRIRLAAVWGLVRMRDRRAAGALTRAATGPIDPVRAFGCIGLGDLGDPRALAVLRERLETDPLILVRAAAAIALGRLGRREAVAPLVASLRTGPEPVRRAAAMSLGALGDAEAAEALSEALFDEDRDLRATAAWALARLGSAGGELPQVDYFRLPDGRIDPQSFVGSLLDPLPPGPPKAPVVALRLAALRRGLDLALAGRPERARVALDSLLAAPAGQGIGLSPLTDEAAGAPAADALAMNRALGTIAESELRRVASLVTNADVEVRKRAVAVLGRIGGPEAQEALLLAVRDSTEAIQRPAIEMLARVGDARAAAALARTLEESNAWAVRAAAATALGRLRAPSAARALAQALRADPFAFVRSAAAEALGALGEEGDVAALEEALHRDSEPMVRLAAATALAGMDGARAREIVRSTHDEDPRVESVLHPR